MNSCDASAWSKRRLGWAFFFVFGVQVSVLFLFGERTSKAPLAQNEKARFRFVAASLTEKELFDATLASDPALFVLPVRNDFSGEAWLRSKQANYAPPEWSEPSRWLPLDTNFFSAAFIDYVRSRESDQIQMAREIVPEEPGLAPPPRMEKASSFRLDGDLSKRELVFHPQMPALQHSEPVADTVVQIAVDGAGQIVTARLLEPRNNDPGNSPTAIEEAMAIARALRFRPINHGIGSNHLMWGKITFHWQTQAVSTTNETLIAP